MKLLDSLQVDGGITPETNNTRDLGSSSLSWAVLYAATDVKVGGYSVWTAGNDGPGSGLNADLVDGAHASSFLQLSGGTMTGELTAAQVGLLTYKVPTNMVFFPEGYNNVISSSPFSNIYYDVLRWSTPIYETSLDNITWTSAPLQKELFSGNQNQWYNVATSTQIGARWTWTLNQYIEGTWLVIDFVYNPGNSAQVLIETSSDGVTWITSHSSSSFYNNFSYFFRLANYLTDKYLRLTLVNTSTTTIGISTIQFLTARGNGIGYGKEHEYPYSWDAYKNITTGAELSLNTINDATGDFVTVSTTGLLTKRTPTEALTDIGGLPLSGGTISGSLTVSGNTTLSGTLAATGATILGNTLSVAGSFTSIGKAYIEGGSSFGGGPAITLAIGDTDTGINWVADGHIELYANNQAVADITTASFAVQKALSVAGFSSFANPLSYTNTANRLFLSIDVDDTAYQEMRFVGTTAPSISWVRDASQQAAFKVYNENTPGTIFTINDAGDATVYGTLQTIGDTTISGNTTISGTLDVTGTSSTFSGGATVGGNLSIGGTTTSTGDVSTTGRFVEKLLSFTPTAIGWYRIATSAAAYQGGQVRIEGAYDNKVQSLEFFYTIRRYAAATDPALGQINVVRSINYNNGPITQIRIGTDPIGTALDIYISSAGVPSPINVYSYGPGSVLDATATLSPPTTGGKIISIVNIYGFQTTDQITSTGIASTGNLTVTGTSTLTGDATLSGALSVTGATTLDNTLSLKTSKLDSVQVTVASTSLTALYSVPIANFQAIKIFMISTITGQYCTRELLALQDGTNGYITEYAVLSSPSTSELVNDVISASVSGTDFIISITAYSSTSRTLSLNITAV